MDNLSRLPKHVSLIMDGNGRWALQRGKERVEFIPKNMTPLS